MTRFGLPDSAPRRHGPSRSHRGLALHVACALFFATLSGAGSAWAQDPDLPGAVPTMELIEAGALVIPMDTANQNVITPFNIKSYGLVNKLLQNEIPVLWAISTTKVKDAADFSVNAQRLLPTAIAATTKSFAGGPFIVTKAYATQAQTIATAFGGSVAVYKTTADVTVDVRYDLRFKPYVGVSNVNTEIHSDILVAAGFPGSNTCVAYNSTTCNWTMVDPFVVNNFACLTSHTDPHRDKVDTKFGTLSGLRTQIGTYLQSGGNFIGQCAAVRLFEGEHGVASTGAGAGYLTTNGIVDQNVNTAVTYLTPNTPFSQFVGAIAYDQGGSWTDGNLGTGAWKNNGHIEIKDTGATQFMAAQGKVRTGIGGNVFYLGGHSYDVKDGKAGAAIGDLNGARMFLNSIFVPPQRPPSCGFNFLTPGQVTIIKDTEPDNPWFDFNLQLSGPSPQMATLQDPGSNECPGDPLCADPENSPAWDRTDRLHFTGLEPTLSATQRYTWTETGLEDGEAEEDLTLADYTTTWECKNAPTPTANPLCDPGGVAFDYDACPALAATCALDGGWLDGVISGSGTQTLPFDLCQGAHVICRFRNEGGPSTGVCLESANAVGDLQVLGGQSPDNVSFTTAAVSAPGGDSDDSIFLASFVPLADASHWSGTVDHFIQPLPVVENDAGNLIPDKSEVCEDDDDTACLAWDAGVELLAQAPDATEVTTDRRIGMGADERRITYAKAASGSAVPLSIHTFDYSDSDLVTDERDLWDGFGIAYINGEPDSEQLARNEARAVIRDALKERTVTIITNPDTGETETLTYVAGDFFHGQPVVVGGPANFFYLANDLEGNGHACSDTVNPNHGYRCFWEQQRRRRKVLIAPANDGQIHAFDAGVFSGSVSSGKLVGDFDHGTGRELFAHIPRPMLEHVHAMTTEDHDFGIDGSLVFDDAFMDPEHTGTPTATDRRWRTVVIGGYREGSRGLYALDLTQPDPVTSASVVDFAGRAKQEYYPVIASSEAPSCSPIQGSLPAGCDRPYPTQLWEFSDQCSVFEASTGTTSISPCDADSNGYPDLGYSWSKVNTGRVRIIPAGESTPVVKFVAVFGGGLDAAHLGDSGNFIYMVDIETGKAIFKARVEGAVPSEPAAVDTDQNGFLDTIYIGTTAGFLYKVDVGTPASIVASTGQVNATTQWTPFKIFDTGGRPLFFPPTVVYESSSGHYAIAFGTGDRQDLWSATGDDDSGRFYFILDSGFTASQEPISSGPLQESDFENIAADADSTTNNFLLAPLGTNRPGWVLELGPDERLVSDALTVAGLVAFTTFDPERPEVCTFGGNGKIYTLLATSADPLSGAGTDRSRTVEGFAGEPVVTPTGFTMQGDSGDQIDPFESDEIQGVRESLMTLFPADCRFGNFSLNISSSLSSREMVPLAQIPVCIARKNWSEQF